ncbi:MAG: arginine N-succinyltransferase [Chlamydiae bacterium]|nr:arginine N-succinyltransferase [Chlamydiota bacterium]MBI3266787.1 arginine N-succinyltransferase [Chlamydiota bacterium]
MFLVRSIEKRDLSAFFRLASILDTYNLPKDKELLAQIIQTSLNSFKGNLKNPHEGRFVFVAEELSSGKIVGTSEILAKRGLPHNPFIYCDVGEDCLKSRTLHKEVKHRYIKLCSTLDGATEIGGLVVDPRYRGKGRGVGKALSYVRFMYMKFHPRKFQKRVLAELLAYLTPKGENPLWDVLGKHFTGLSYHRADRLSVFNKEFILSLFPAEKIYTCLLPERVQRILERPGLHTVPAQVLLEKIGLKYLRQVDPFDGGPLYGAKLSDVTIYQKTKLYPFSGMCEEGKEGLLLFEESSRVKACYGLAKIMGENIFLNLESVRALNIRKGNRVLFYRF